MPMYLIEVPHEEEIVACAKVIKSFLDTGSHYLANADWGCEDGVHLSWMIVDVDTKEDARRILPPAFRAQAKIVQLTKFTMEKVDHALARHSAKTASAR